MTGIEVLEEMKEYYLKCINSSKRCLARLKKQPKTRPRDRRMVYVKAQQNTYISLLQLMLIRIEYERQDTESEATNSRRNEEDN